MVVIHCPGTLSNNAQYKQEVHMRMLIDIFKILFTVLFNPLPQDFVDELVLHEQAKHNQRHYGIGDGGRSLRGKYFN